MLLHLHPRFLISLSRLDRRNQILIHYACDCAFRLIDLSQSFSSLNLWYLFNCFDRVNICRSRNPSPLLPKSLPHSSFPSRLARPVQSSHCLPDSDSLQRFDYRSAIAPTHMVAPEHSVLCKLQMGMKLRIQGYRRPQLAQFRNLNRPNSHSQETFRRKKLPPKHLVLRRMKARLSYSVDLSKKLIPFGHCFV